jgi:hypothetical protein
MIIDRYFLLYIFIVLISIVSFTGLLWITKFVFLVKTYKRDNKTIVENVEISQDNLIMSKITVILIWIKLLLFFLFTVNKLVDQLFKKN